MHKKVSVISTPSSTVRSAAWDWGLLRRQAVREARKSLASGVDAEDAAQDALLRAWKKRAQCHEPEAREAWIAVISRNEALRTGARLQRRHVHEQLTDDHVLAESVAAPAEPDAAPSLDHELLLGFDARDRQLLALRYVEDQTYVQIAAVTGLALGTVKVRLHRARIRLRARMESSDGRD